MKAKVLSLLFLVLAGWLHAIPYATGVTLTGNVSLVAGELGIKFINTGGAPVAITHLKLWNHAGNNQIHALRIYATSDPASLVETVYCDASLGIPGTWQEIPLTNPHVVPVGGAAYISAEVGGIDGYHRQINGPPLVQNLLTGPADIGYTLPIWVGVSSITIGGGNYTSNGPVSFSYSSPVKTWTNPTAKVRATDGSIYNVKSALLASVSGDKVTVAAGTFTWGEGATTITVPAGVTLEGDETPGATVVNMHLTSPAGATNGMIILGAGSVVKNLTINGPDAALHPPFRTSANDWRLSKIIYTQVTGRNSYFIYADPVIRGLIDQCTFNGGEGRSELVFSRGPSNSWDTDHSMGGANNIFIESCIFNGNGYINDANSNSRVVVRFNTINGKLKTDGHGVWTNSPNRGVRHMEIYNNWWASGTTEAIELRGGGGRIFNNTTPTGSTMRFIITEYGVFSKSGVFSAKYQTPNDWPIRDQIGRGKYEVAGVWQSATSEPVYRWNNRKGSAGWDHYGQTGANGIEKAFPTYRIEEGNPSASFVWEDIIRADRDYFKEVSDFNGSTGIGIGTLEDMADIAANGVTKLVGVGFWATDDGEWDSTNGATKDGRLYRWNGSAFEVGYMPYPFPHPLRSAEDTPTPDTTAPTPNPSTIASVVVNSATEITVTATAATDEDSSPVEYAFSKDNGSTYTDRQVGDSYTFPGLAPSTTYYFRVTVYDAVGNVTTASAAASAMTSAAPVTPVLVRGKRGGVTSRF